MSICTEPKLFAYLESRKILGLRDNCCEPGNSYHIQAPLVILQYESWSNLTLCKPVCCIMFQVDLLDMNISNRLFLVQPTATTLIQCAPIKPFVALNCPLASMLFSNDWVLFVRTRQSTGRKAVWSSFTCHESNGDFYLGLTILSAIRRHAVPVLYLLV